MVFRHILVHFRHVLCHFRQVLCHFRQKFSYFTYNHEEPLPISSDFRLHSVLVPMDYLYVGLAWPIWTTIIIILCIIGRNHVIFDMFCVTFDKVLATFDTIEHFITWCRWETRWPVKLATRVWARPIQT